MAKGCSRKICNEWELSLSASTYLPWYNVTIVLILRVDVDAFNNKRENKMKNQHYFTKEETTYMLISKNKQFHRNPIGMVEKSYQGEDRMTQLEIEMAEDKILDCYDYMQNRKDETLLIIKLEDSWKIRRNYI